MPPDEAIAAIRAWTRLDEAFADFNRQLQRRHGVTGAQLAMLRLIDEWSRCSQVGVALADLRSRLSLHPATAGQLLDRLATRGLLDLVEDRTDRRRRRAVLTVAGRELLVQAPLAGPVRLRHVDVDASRLRRLAAALDDALDLFGLTDHVDPAAIDPVTSTNTSTNTSTSTSTNNTKRPRSHPEMKVLGFDNVFLPVGDLEAAVTFYRDVVGLPVHRRFDAMGSALFSVGSETPGLGVGVAEFPASGERPTPDGAPGFAATKVWFEVPDARAAADELTGLGVEPITPPFEIPTGWTFEIRDPWGNILGFTDYTRRQELARSDSPESSTS